ncbi:MAG: hypothetical protein HY707_11105 [Ignavibacteriae bacterium]|nr:hypothetical protein [Ignavibacteriota bacterium]
MGQQQLLLIILGVIVVGIAIAVGATHFGAYSVEANKDGITGSLVNIGADAYKYKLYPSILGGGGRSYVNYSIPSRFASDEHGTYSVASATVQTCVLVGTSSLNASWIATCTVDSLGRIDTVLSSGW